METVRLHKIQQPSRLQRLLEALVFAGTFVSVISITIYVSKRSSGEISEFGTHRSLWRI